MNLKTYLDAGSFLADTGIELEQNEAANSLMLGICGQLVKDPNRYEGPPCLKTVEDQGKLVFAAVMTPPHKLVVYGRQGDLQRGARTLVENLIWEGWGVPGVLGPELAAEAFAEAWSDETGGTVALEGRLQGFELRKVKVPRPKRGELRAADQADLELVTRWWAAFNQDIFGQADQESAVRAASYRITAGEVHLWDDQGPVSMAAVTRPTRTGISIGMVYTPPEFRSRGHATACVGELSRQLLSKAWAFCALFVNVNNTPANIVYRRIGYAPVCDYREYAFSET
jgi:predicted GNAT family acetyltransferase